ncbi:MAG: hypothetical protein ACREBC_38000, partial [Pyrinomonadaceae bacterium]
MRVRLIQSFFVLFLTNVLASSASAFDVYVETFFKNQPDLAKYGVKDGDLGMIYEGSMFGKGGDRQLLPSESKTLGAIQKHYK